MPAFLFTDLESSTKLWEQHPHAMRGALELHDSILRDAVETSGGSVVKTTGDGIMAVFGSASDSIVACLHAQREMVRASWQETGPLRVRIGVHSGDADRRNDDYFGPAVNRAARIMAAGHGGQVLVSGTVAALVAERLPDGADLLDLGDHRLKDLTQPERLFQLLHPDLRADFPPPSTLDIRANNLPVQGTEFFGRDGEIAAIQKLLDDPSNRLVTLTGPGGTGKTRLGLQVAAERLDRYRDGVFFVDLSEESQPTAVFEAISRTTGVGRKGEGDALKTLVAGLSDQDLLMVLDNFEQVTDAAPGVAELLASCPGVQIVATSREALRIRAERVYAVPPLSLPARADAQAAADSEAVQLFLERAAVSRPGFTVSDQDLGAIVDICVQLDGLPLAIELAAARLSLFSPAELAARLAEKREALTSGARDLPARQRTLTGTIEWSHDLLDGDERALFAVMSVFSTASLEAVESLGEGVLGDLPVLDLAASLVAKSLVRRVDDAGSSRLAMLQTIRAYAAERLAKDRDLEQKALSRHAQYYSAFGSGLRDALLATDRQSALDSLGVEIGNLRAAWRHWVEVGDLEELYSLLGVLWALHDAKGWYHAAIDLANDMLAVLAAADPTARRAGDEMTLRASLARALMVVRGYTPEVEDAFRQALELADEAGSAAHRYPVLRALGSYYVGTGDFDKCAAIGEELLTMGDIEADTEIRIEGLLLAGISDAYRGKVESGLGQLDEAARLFDPRAHGPGRFRLGTTPGVVVRVASSLTRWLYGELDRAVSENESALSLAREIDHPFSIAYALYHSGFFEFQRRRYEVTRQRAVELGEIARQHDFQIWDALGQVLEGVAVTMLGEPERGLMLTEAGLDLYQGLTTPPVFWPLLLALRATCFAAAERPGTALQTIDEAIAITGDQEHIYPEFRVLRGDLLQAVGPGEIAPAELAYQAAIRGSRQNGALLVELQALTRLASIDDGAGDGRYVSELRTVYAQFTQGFEEHDLVAAQRVVGVG